MGLKKAWDKWGKGSKLARGLAFTKKGKAKVDQDRIDKADEKQKQKDEEKNEHVEEKEEMVKNGYY